LRLFLSPPPLFHPFLFLSLFFLSPPALVLLSSFIPFIPLSLSLSLSLSSLSSLSLSLALFSLSSCSRPSLLFHPFHPSLSVSLSLSLPHAMLTLGATCLVRL